MQYPIGMPHKDYLCDFIYENTKLNIVFTGLSSNKTLSN